MKIGVLQFFSWPERRVELSQVCARALQRIEIMDRTGYDAVWLAEHHFSSFSVCPSVHMVGVLAAARTQRLRIGTGVSLAPFYHPLRLAEEVALLADHLGDSKKALKLYEPFMKRVVAELDNSWELSSTDIDAALKEIGT